MISSKAREPLLIRAASISRAVSNVVTLTASKIRQIHTNVVFGKKIAGAKMEVELRHAASYSCQTILLGRMFSQPCDQAVATPKFNIVSIDELTRVLKGGVVVRGDKDIRVRDMAIVIDTVSPVF
jgi:hypothetical protein